MLASLRAHAARLLASAVAVVVAVGFVVATLVLDETARTTVLSAVAAEHVDADAVVTSTDGATPDAAAVAALPSVRAVSQEHDLTVQAVVPGRAGVRYLRVGTAAEDPGLRWQQVSAGALPTRTGEVAVAEGLDAPVGAVLQVTTYGPVPGNAPSTQSVIGMPSGTGYDIGWASLLTKSGSEVVRWKVTVFAVSSASTPS